MIEFPEAIVLAKQIRLSLVGKEVVAVTAAHSPTSSPGIAEPPMGMAPF